MEKSWFFEKQKKRNNHSEKKKKRQVKIVSVSKELKGTG